MEKKQITISAVLECLKEGMPRKEMAGHFGITQAELARHFRHPKLRGRRPRARPQSVLVDDTEDGTEPQAEATGLPDPPPPSPLWGSLLGGMGNTNA